MKAFPAFVEKLRFSIFPLFHHVNDMCRKNPPRFPTINEIGIHEVTLVYLRPCKHTVNVS